MNYSTAIFLISDKVRAVAACYDDGENAPREVFKTFDRNLKVGDYVLIPTDTRHKMSVFKIAEVDADVDLESNHKMKWIIGVVDRANFEDIERQESEAIATIKSAERRKKRDELRDALMKDTGETLKQLPIYADGDEAVKLPPEPE